LALTSIDKTVPAAQNDRFVLALYPSSLPERFLVTFSMTCKKSVAKVQVETNGPPTSGVFRITPSLGKEFDDLFGLSASLWVDDDLPLAFAFSFGDTRETIKPMGASSYIDSSLPSGDQNNDFKLACYVVVYDSLLAGAESTATVTVNRLELPAAELGDKLGDKFDSSMESTDPNELISFLSVASSMLNFVDCSSTPDCSSLNRNSCKDTALTCGSCLPDYLGTDGDSNTPCFDLNQRKLASDSVPNQACLNDCSSNGECKFFNSITNKEVQSCSVLESSCYAICICDDGYYGSSCSMTEEELIAKQSIREKLVTGATSVETDSNSVAVQSSMTGLTSITKQIDEISYDTAQVALIRGLDLLDMGVDVKLLPNYASSLFKSLVDMTLIAPSQKSTSRSLYSKFTESSHESKVYVAKRRLTTSDSNTAALQTEAANKYGGIILQSMVSGQANVDTIESALRFTSAVPAKSVSKIGTYVNLTTPLSQLESRDGTIPYSVQLFVSSSTKKDVKLNVGVINELGYGEISNDFSSSPMTLLVEDMSVCGSSGCKALVTLQNTVDVEYIGQNVTIEKYRTKCNGTAAIVKYPCSGSTEDQDLTLSVECNSTFKGYITSTCPYVKSYPLCKMILPSTLSSDSVQLTSDPCTLKRFTAKSTTCECKLSSKVSRRRLSSSGNDFQITSNSQTEIVSSESSYEVGKNPTYAPTSKPTFRPTPSTMVTVEVSQKIDGLDASDFDSDEKLAANGRIIVLAIVDTINSDLNIDWNIQEEDVDLISVQSGRRLSTFRELLSSSISITYQITAGATGLTASQAVSSIQSALQTASSNGNFGLSIQSAYNTVVLAGGWTGTVYSGGTLTVNGPTVTVISVNTHKPTAAPTLKADSGLSKSNNSTIIIAAVVAIIGFLSVSLAYYYYLRHKKKNLTAETTDEADTGDVTIEILRGATSPEDDNNDDAPEIIHTISYDVDADLDANTGEYSNEIVHTIGHDDLVVSTALSEEMESTSGIDVSATRRSSLESTSGIDVNATQRSSLAEKISILRSSRQSGSETTMSVTDSIPEPPSVSIDSTSTSQMMPPKPPSDSDNQTPRPLLTAPPIVNGDPSPNVASALAKVKLLSKKKLLISTDNTAALESNQNISVERDHDSNPQNLSTTALEKMQSTTQKRPSSNISSLIEKAKSAKESNLVRSPSPSPPTRTNPSIPPQSSPTASEMPSAVALAIEKMKKFKQAAVASPPRGSQLPADDRKQVIDRVKSDKVSNVGRQPSPPTRSNPSIPPKSSPSSSQRKTTVELAVEKMKSAKESNLVRSPSPPTRTNPSIPPQSSPTVSEKPSSVSLAMEKMKKFKEAASPRESPSPTARKSHESPNKSLNNNDNNDPKPGQVTDVLENLRRIKEKRQQIIDESSSSSEPAQSSVSSALERLRSISQKKGNQNP